MVKSLVKLQLVLAGVFSSRLFFFNKNNLLFRRDILLTHMVLEIAMTADIIVSNLHQ